MHSKKRLISFISENSNDHKDQQQPGPSREPLKPVPVQQQQISVSVTEPEPVISENEAEAMVTDESHVLLNEEFVASLRKAVILSSGTYNDPAIIHNNPHVFAVPTVPAKTLVLRPETRELPQNSIANGNKVGNGNGILRDPRLQNGFVPMTKTNISAYNCANILTEVLSWNTDWIGAENPPVVENVTQLSSMPNTFQSYAQYVK